MRCDELPAGVDYAEFDYGVNSGIGRAPRVLRRVLGMNGSSSTVTPEVIAAARKRDAKLLIAAICDERLRFLKALRTWPTFGAGWNRRVAEVRMAATAMAERGPRRAAVPETSEHDPAPGKAQVPEPKVIKEAIRTGAPTVTAIGGATFWDWVVSHPKISVAIVVCVAIAVGYGLHWLEQWHQARQNAPMPDTPVVPELVGKGD
jgi:lysozyme family protein